VAQLAKGMGQRGSSLGDDGDNGSGSGTVSTAIFPVRREEESSLPLK
jgi:hypothetical protein